MIKINADAFYKTWLKFSDDFISSHPDWVSAYDNNSIWSNLFLGGKKSSSDTSPIGKYFSTEFKDLNLRYRSEDGLYDLSLFTADYYKNIPYLKKNEILMDDKKLYPVSYDVVMEIENDLGGSWQEMIKLTWIRCPLKVLITYNYKSANEDDMLRQSFSTIISQSNLIFKESENTEYLLIIGNKDVEDLKWKSYKFNSTGNQI